MEPVQDYLDNFFYTNELIIAYEKFYGPNFQSTGGMESTKILCRMLKLSVGDKVLDIGCGLGGSAIYIAQEYGARVFGVEMSQNMHDMLTKRLSQSAEQNVTFMLADATKLDLPEGSFDTVYSRDTILHIENPQDLYNRFYKWLKPGGQLLVSNYCCSKEEVKSEDFKRFTKKWGYHLRSIEETSEMISSSGFRMTEALDRSDLQVQYNRQGMKNLEEQKEEFVKDFKDGIGEVIYESLKKSVMDELEHCLKGDIRWGIFLAFPCHANGPKVVLSVVMQLRAHLVKVDENEKQ